MVYLNIVGLFCLLGCLSLFSCAKRIGFSEPEVPVGPMTVRIVPVWNVTERPGRVNALFYNPAGVLAKEVQLPVDGGEVTLDKDNYRVILSNPDAERVVFSQMDQFANATARVVGVGKSGSELENPGALFSTAFELPLGTPQAQLLMVQHSIAVTLRISARDAYWAGASVVAVHLRNVADGVNLSTGKAYHTSASDFTVVAFTNGAQVNEVYSFTGSTLGCCVHPECLNSAGHEVYADIELRAADGAVKVVSVDISTPLKVVQENVATVAIDIMVTPMGLEAVVTNWTTGAASGGITEEIR